MIRRATPRLQAYIVLGAGGLLAGAAFGRPEPAILVAPLLLAALAGILFAEDPGLRIDVTAPSDRLLEGDDVRLDIRLQASRRVPWLEVALVLPPDLIAADGIRARGLQLEPGVPRAYSVLLRGRRWGNHRIQGVVARARDRLGFFAFEARIDPGLVLRVFPRPESIRRLIQPAETQASFGNQTSRRAGDGIEFSGVRPYSPGDRIRSVNWRLSSRRTELHVNELHPESSTDVVILLDTFTDLAAEDQSSLASAVRAVTGIANHYLRRRDRVGLIAFGASIRWLTPATGLLQAYRIVDTLLDATATVSVSWKGIDLIPPGSLPPKALVVALSPLVDERMIDALFNLRARGFDVAVIEVRPESYVAEPSDAFGATARRIWELQRAMLRDRFARVGVAVAPWSFAVPLEPALEEISVFRRQGRLVLA
jgi:uncharacterized protein (DUF58 family)